MTHAPGPKNRLAAEKSPYLLQHATNPVDWYPYGEEAFARARAENKPIFLSIGYSTCHWCHVMERESFEDSETARVMNELYINIKVDREERPDVDQIYMQAVMALTRQGGWPLSVWLTPDLRPFYGGTYFPPDARFGRPGFRDVMRHLAHVYHSRPEDVNQNAGALVNAMQKSEATPSGAISDDILARAADDLAKGFDPENGGFGDAPKFPRPASLFFLAHRHARVEWPEGVKMLEKTLECMWRGGIYDHVGGGFARYSTDARWIVPHFEKMLYDNALMIDAYLDGYVATGRSDFAEVVDDILTFVGREMTHAEGGFFTAQDADSEGEEGRFYVFEPGEIREALGPEAELAMRVFGVSDAGNFEGKNILCWPKSPAEALSAEKLSKTEFDARVAAIRRRLYSYREMRKRPGLDDKIIVSWNGLMIAACARAGAVLDDPHFVAMGEMAAEFIWSTLMMPDGRLLRRWREGEARFDASLDDYAALALAFLRLFEATGSATHLERAIVLKNEVLRRFWDDRGDGFFYAEVRDDLIVRMKESYDGALPSANSLAALLCARLGALLDDESLRERAKRTVSAFAEQLNRMPEAYPLLLQAWAEVNEFPRTLFVVAGDGLTLTSPEFRDVLSRAFGAGVPGRLIIPVLPTERRRIEKAGIPLHGKTAVAGGVAAYLCEEASCRPW